MSWIIALLLFIKLQNLAVVSRKVAPAYELLPLPSFLPHSCTEFFSLLLPAIRPFFFLILLLIQHHRHARSCIGDHDCAVTLSLVKTQWPPFFRSTSLFSEGISDKQL